MAGPSLTTNSTLMCPHGATVQITSTYPMIKNNGTPLITANDVFTIVGCPFQLPGPTPSPCVTVQWLVPDTRVKIQGNPTLSQSSTGLCLSAAQIPQGPVIIVQTQPRVKSQ